jgi:CRP-like cAMP-binding protein
MPMPDWELFQGLPPQEIRRLVAVATRRSFGRGEVVFHRGDPADTLHLVVKGRFAARMTTPVGDTATITVHGPGDAFGELALVGTGAARSTTVAALEPGETFAVHRDDFTRLRARYPAVDDVLVQLLARRLRRTSELLLEALYASAEVRVLRRLVELSEVYGPEIPLTQDELGSLAGTSRATVNRVLRAEAERATVTLRRGRTTVVDAPALARRAGLRDR